MILNRVVLHSQDDMEMKVQHIVINMDATVRIGIDCVSQESLPHQTHPGSLWSMSHADPPSSHPQMRHALLLRR